MLIYITTVFKTLFNGLNNVLDILLPKNPPGYLKLEGQYYSEEEKCVYVVIQIRGKRTTFAKPLQELVRDKDIIKSLHPVETLALGILANEEINGIIDKLCNNWHKTKRFVNFCADRQIVPMLRVAKKYYSNSKKEEIVVLVSPTLNKEIEVPRSSLQTNAALLSALDPRDTISIGYDIGTTANKYS